MTRATLALFLSVLPFTGQAMDLAMVQGSALVADDVTEQGSYALPQAAFENGVLPTQTVTGHVSRQVWHLTGENLTSEQLIDPLRRQIQGEGFKVLLDCDAARCGGFDFRFTTEVMPAPDMFVDLVDYRFLSAIKQTRSGTAAISALVSATDDVGFTQLIAVQPGPPVDPLPLVSQNLSPPDDSVPEPIIQSSDFAANLEDKGHAVLSDLKFETGSSVLTDGSFDSLRAVAAFLADNPERRIALVGHTDNVGSLQGNITLSERRASSVMQRLINTLNVASAQIEAKGVGYLAPIASNETEDGRRSNRRVDAVLLPN